MSPGTFAPLVAFAVAVAVVRSLLVGAARRFALDQPNERSLHTQPVPRLGGLGIMAGTLAGWALAPAALSPTLWSGVVLLGAVSLVDDVRGLPIGARFLAHFVAAGAFVAALAHDGPPGGIPWPLLPVLVVGTVWVINLYNFMDGSDGLAGGMALFGFGAYAAAAWLAGATGLALACGSISAAAGGFLVFNFHPAKTFMGDIGSIPLGFLAATLGIAGWARSVWPAWLPFVVFSPFLVDATVTLAQRALRREKVWQAHRSHYYQRVILLGLGHRRLALAEYALMAALDLSAIAALRAPLAGVVALVVGWIGIYAVVMRGIDGRWRRFERKA